MDPDNVDLMLENKSLKNEFSIRNLDLEQVFCESPHDLELENRQLYALLDWVNKYTTCRSRKKMEAEGYLYPPIDPDFSPDNDWYLFERWMKGLPVHLTVFEQLSPRYIPKNPHELSEKELASELEYLEKALYKIRICVDLNEDVPLQLIYENLIDMMNEEFTLMIEGFCHINGCGGYCPGCFQRPWCQSGSESCWPEDEKIGEMYLHDSVRKYVSASPMSLEVLRKFQAEEERRMTEFELSYKADENDQINPAAFEDDIDDLAF